MIMAIFVLSALEIAVIFFRCLISFLMTVPLLCPAKASAECFHNLDGIFDQGRDYFLHGQYLLSTQQFSFYSQLSCSPKDQDRGRLRWAQSLYELGEIEEGNFILAKMKPTSEEFSKSRIIRAWYQPSLIFSLPDNEKIRFENWEKQQDFLPTAKSAALSGTMSAVLPGLGQVYNGNYQSALFSFVLNTLFLSATLELHSKNMDATALASGIVFSVVYIGNIVGTIQSSRSINRQTQEPILLDLKSRLFPELLL